MPKPEWLKTKKRRQREAAEREAAAVATQQTNEVADRIAEHMLRVSHQQYCGARLDPYGNEIKDQDPDEKSDAE